MKPEEIPALYNPKLTKKFPFNRPKLIINHVCQPIILTTTLTCFQRNHIRELLKHASYNNSHQHLTRNHI